MAYRVNKWKHDVQDMLDRFIELSEQKNAIDSEYYELSKILQALGLVDGFNHILKPSPIKEDVQKENDDHLMDRFINNVWFKDR